LYNKTTIHYTEEHREDTENHREILMNKYSVELRNSSVELCVIKLQDVPQRNTEKIQITMEINVDE